MNAKELLVSNVNIAEDGYSYKALFVLGIDDKSMSLDLTELENESKLEEIRSYFNLVDENEIIKRTISDMVIDKAGISSRNIEGENYNESSNRKSIERGASSLDRA